MSLVRKLVPSYLSGAVLAAIGYLLGTWYVWHVIGGDLIVNDPKQTGNFEEQGYLLGFILLAVGWFIGIGAFKYPFTWMLGLKDPDHAEEMNLAGKDKGWIRYFQFTTDHKVVGIQYLVVTLIMLAFGGLGAMMIRTELMFPGALAFPTETYNTLVTMHGMLMILTVISLFVGPFGNFIVPIMCGARDMAFPRLNALSIAFLIIGLVIFGFIPFVGLGHDLTLGGGVQTGWTVYGTIADQTGVGMLPLAVSVLFAGISSMLGAINVIVTMISMRAPGMTYTRLPMTVWAVIASAILSALGTSSFAVDLLLIVIDRVFRTSFFYAATYGDYANSGGYIGGGSSWLSQNLFWFFGHPEVYLIVLPAFGFVMDGLSVFSRKPLFGYKSAILGMYGVVVCSFLVWAHHEFVSGWLPELRGFYMATTELISVPTGLIFLVALGTIWRGRIWVTLPSAYAFVFLWNFLIGGITGVYLSDVPADVQLHGGMFVTAHFHYTIVGGAVFGFLGALYYWFPKMTGRFLDEGLGWISFWGITIFFNTTFLGMFTVGLQGMPRRVADYSPIFATGNFLTSISAFLLGASFILFFYNVIYSWIAGERCTVANPWGANSLEWMIPSPPPLENFEEIPVVRGGPYTYAEPAQAGGADTGVQTGPAIG
ncbi:MAG TPA: cbb3-type cytochrome c oxidase subunit I [Ktedonobacterales bacterium]